MYNLLKEKEQERKKSPSVFTDFAARASARTQDLS